MPDPTSDPRDFFDALDVPELLAGELQTVPGCFRVDFAAFSAFQFAALLQLALRHPGVSGTNRAAAETFVRAVRIYFAGCPLILASLDHGEDPSQDIRMTAEELGN